VSHDIMSRHRVVTLVVTVVIWVVTMLSHVVTPSDDR
jgi:hypothetical protein